MKHSIRAKIPPRPEEPAHRFGVLDIPEDVQVKDVALVDGEEPDCEGWAGRGIDMNKRKEQRCPH